MVINSTENLSGYSDQPSKKARLFSAKEFRKHLKSTTDSIRLQSVNEFLQLCQRDETQDCILEYLESGGSCLELLQMLETELIVPHSTIMTTVKHILLEINAKYAQYQSSAFGASTYFLNTHMTMINNMLGLNSKGKDRKAVLELLTVIVAFSPNLAKDVLIHVNFNPTNLEILTKHTGEDGVRYAFVNFLIAFLVNGYYPTISAILEKRGLLMSIVNGLKYDDADTVCIVLAAFKSHILENPYVSKTSKMKAFSTPVVKDIVNLYNWKGPEGYDPKKKRKRTVTVDEYLKSKVNASVHNFLLTLCTSYKFGVIFRDRQLGLGKKTQNSLIYTVLESLDHPWEHSYAGELVTKICTSCPDLTKTLWLNLKPFLEPRTTVKWINAVKFAKKLVNELQPSCIEFCARELSVYQFAQITQMLVAPMQILKTIIPEKKMCNKKIIDYHIVSFLIQMLKAIRLYIECAERWLSVENVHSLKLALYEHIARHFPTSLDVLVNWEKVDDETYTGLDACTITDYLNIVFDLFELYENICPQLLDGLSIKINIHDLLVGTSEDKTESNALQVKMIRLFLKCDHGLFLPKTHLFAYVVSLILKYYYETKHSIAYDTLELLLENTGIFEFEAKFEISVWINAIFDLKTFDESVGNLFVQMLNVTSAKMVDYLTSFSKIKDVLNDHTENLDFVEILENLDNQTVHARSIVRHVNVSPVIMGLFEYLSGNNVSKSMKCYVNVALVNLLHIQTNPHIFLEIVSIYRHDVIYENVLNYLFSWKPDAEFVVLTKHKKQLNLLSKFSEAIVQHEFDAFIEKFEDFQTYEGQVMHLLQMCVFYVANFANANKLTSTHVDNCLKFIKHVWDNKQLDVLKSCYVIFGNPTILTHFSCLQLHKENSRSLCTNFILKLIKMLKDLDVDLELFLRQFRLKLYNSLIKIVKKSSKKNVEILDIIEVFDLNYWQCYDLLKLLAGLNEMHLVNEHNLSLIYKILTYTFRRYNDLSKNYTNLWMLDDNIIEAFSKQLRYLNNCSEQFDTSSLASSLRIYLESFPHSISYVDQDLFKSTVTRKEYCKENTSLAVLLLRKNPKFIQDFISNIDNICSKKGLILQLLEVIVTQIDNKDTLRTIYEKFAPSILKSLQKPQKAGQHFEQHYQAVGLLLNEFLSVENCKTYVEKIHKYETTEIFHTYLLEVIFNKVIFVAENYDEKIINNCILIFVHLVVSMFKKRGKNDEDWGKLHGVVETIERFLGKIFADEKAKSISYVQVNSNEAFRTFCKFSLKFGLSGNSSLLKLLCSLIKLINAPEHDLNLIMDMVVSHSEFLELILSDDGACKTELLSLILELFRRDKTMMSRKYVPIVLAAYGATVKTSDRIILSLLKMFESVPNQTNFYDFKPFLWGRAAANHYSVRSDIQKALWRQPRFGAVLDILEEHLVIYTIKHHPLDLTLNSTTLHIIEENLAKSTYDLGFLLPLFTQLLAPENAVQTYRFTKSGALSLTIVSLSSEDKDLRAAACHVLSRFYNHVEARLHGKDNALWLRYVEAICKGVCVLDDFKLNNFAAVFLARMALILTQPLHVMYVPLSHYLGAKSLLDFNSVPELYTLLHSPDVNYKEYRGFILEILKDGLRTFNDFIVALRSRAFKLIMELFTSSVSDVDTKLLILDVFKSASEIPQGFKMLCSGSGLLSWLHQVVCCASYGDHAILSRVFDIFCNVETTKIDCHLITLSLTRIIDNVARYNFKDDVLVKLLKVSSVLLDSYPKFLTETRLKDILSFVDNKECEYLLSYGQNVDFDLNVGKDKHYFVKVLTLKLNTNVKNLL